MNICINIFVIHLHQISSKSMNNTVCTLFELTEGEESEGTGKLSNYNVLSNKGKSNSLMGYVI